MIGLRLWYHCIVAAAWRPPPGITYRVQVHPAERTACVGICDGSSMVVVPLGQCRIRHIHAMLDRAAEALADEECDSGEHVLDIARMGRDA